MASQTLNKYKTGLYYKSCLYSNSEEWISGDQPGGNGHLIAAVCINKAIKKMDIAIDGTLFSTSLYQKALMEAGVGFKKLGISQKEQDEYEVFSQTTGETSIVPVFKKMRKNTFFGKLFSLFIRKK